MKMIVLFRRRQDLSPKEFREHYESHHAPLARRLFPYIQVYRRNYVRHDLTHARAVPAGDTKLDFDVITEITFAVQEDYDRMMRDMRNPEVRDQVVQDELRFLDRSATVVFLVDEARDPTDRT